MKIIIALTKIAALTVIVVLTSIVEDVGVEILNVSGIKK